MPAKKLKQCGMCGKETTGKLRWYGPGGGSVCSACWTKEKSWRNKSGSKYPHLGKF